MEMIIGGMQGLLMEIVEIAALVFSYIGVGICIYSGLRGFVQILQKNAHAKHHLETGLSTSLTFLFVGEILHTVTSESLERLAVIAALFALRALMSILLYWEGKHEKE